MFERFTEDARDALTAAMDQAQKLRYPSVEPQHLMLGLLTQHSGKAARVLESFGVTLERTRAEILGLTAPDHDASQTEIPLSAPTKGVIDHSVQEATRLQSGYVATEHLLLGLVADPGDVVEEMLQRMGVGPYEIRARTLEITGMPANGRSEEAHGDPESELPLSHASRRALSFAESQAAMDGAPKLTTDHFLLGLAADPSSAAGQMLAGLGITAATIEAERHKYQDPD